MKQDIKVKIIELLKEECGLKGQVINMLVDLEGFNEVLNKNNKTELLSQYINTINKIHDEVLKLSSKDN